MSTQVYSCNVPERRSKDHISRLLALIALFTFAALVSGSAAYQARQYPVLFVACAVLCLASTASATVCFWVWKDVHNDG